MQNLFTPYIKSLENVDDGAIKKIAATIFSCVMEGGRIFAAGNGGSNCVSQHFVSDLTKAVGGPKMIRCPAINLGDNTALTSAIANDSGYHHIFESQVVWHGLRDNDAIVVFSVSATSPNIMRLMANAQGPPATVIAIMGRTIKSNTPYWDDIWHYLTIETGLDEKSALHYYVCESVFSCIAHEIARQFHILRGNYSVEG